MRGVVMHQAGDVRVEEREDPRIIDPTDAVIRLTSTCICGSDLALPGVEPVDHQVMGHEYMGVIEQIGSAVADLQVGDHVIGSFVISDNTCEICRTGYPSKCVHAEFVAQTIGTQAERARIPHADGTLVALPGEPDGELVPHLLAASDVLGTASKRLGAERIIAMSRHADRQELARFYGATDIVEERGDEGVVRVMELTEGLGAHSVIEAVGTQESTMQAIGCTRPGGHMGFVGVNHDVQIPGIDLFFADIHLHGGPAPVRRFLPGLVRQIWDGEIEPGKVFDMTLPLEQAPQGYEAMDQRRAIKVLLTP